MSYLFARKTTTESFILWNFKYEQRNPFLLALLPVGKHPKTETHKTNCVWNKQKTDVVWRSGNIAHKSCCLNVVYTLNSEKSVPLNMTTTWARVLHRSYQMIHTRLFLHQLKHNERGQHTAVFTKYFFSLRNIYSTQELLPCHIATSTFRHWNSLCPK